MFRRKTLKRLTRFGLCFYVFSYIMALTVCAEEFPLVGGTDASYGIPVVESAFEDATDTERGLVVENIETGEEPEMLGAGGGGGKSYGGWNLNTYINYTEGTVTGLYLRLADDIDFRNHSVGFGVNITQDIELDSFNTSQRGYVGRFGTTTIDGNGHKIKWKDVANNTDLGMFSDFEHLAFRNTIFTGFKSGIFSTHKIEIAKPQELVFVNCTFINNEGTKGGAVFVNDTSSVNFINCTFINNTATNNGGVAYISYHGSLYVEGSRFENNTANGNGGAIYIDSDGELSVTSSIFTGNTVPSGEKGSAIWCDSSKGTVGDYWGSNVFLKNNGTPVVYFGTKGSYSVGDNWYGHTDKDYSQKPPVEGIDVSMWRFIELKRIVNHTSGGYIIWFDNAQSYDSTIVNGTPIGIISSSTSEHSSYDRYWRYPEMRFKVKAENVSLLSDEFILMDGKNAYAPLSRDRDSDDFYGMINCSSEPGATYSVSLPELGYTKSFNRTLMIHGTSAETDRNKNYTIVGYNSSSEVYVEGDGWDMTVQNKSINVTLDGKKYQYKIKELTDWYGSASFKMVLDENVKPGIYDATYEVDGFLPQTQKVNVTKFLTPTSFEIYNQTAVDEGAWEEAEPDKKKIYMSNFTEMEKGKGFTVRMELISHKRVVDRGKMYIINGTDDINKGLILNQSAVTPEKMYIDLNLSLLPAGNWSLIALYREDSDNKDDWTYDTCNTSGYHPLNFTVIGENNPDDYSDAGVSIGDGESITKELSGGDFTLNVTAANPGIGSKWTFESSNESVATVSGKGIVHPLAVGNTTITVNYESLTTRGSAKIVLIVVDSEPSPGNLTDAGVAFADGEELEKTIGDPDFTLNVTAAAQGSGGTWGFESSNESVATIDDKGLVSLKAVGRTDIIATYKSSTTFGKATLLLIVKPAGNGTDAGNNTVPGNDSNIFVVPINGSVVENQTISLGTGSGGEEVKMEMFYTQNVTFTGNKFKAKDIEDLGNGTYSLGGVVIKLNTTLMDFSKPSFKFKNVKHATDNPKTKKKPCFIVSFKANGGVSKENKTAVKGANKVLKKNPVEFRIEQADITYATDVKPYVNGKKTKVGKADMSISGNKLTLKNKRDYDATIADPNVSFVGKGDYKGNITVPLS